MTKRAKGSFEVKLSPEANDEGPGAAIGRMALDKQYEGDLEATARGQMLTAVSEAEGSAGYVAMERVEGALHGLSGSFVLQHSGTMANDEQRVDITIVPDSGTGELEGITGNLIIKIKDGEHRYELDYTID